MIDMNRSNRSICKECGEPIKRIGLAAWTHGDNAVCKGWCTACSSWVPCWEQKPPPAPLSCHVCGRDIKLCHDAEPIDLAPQGEEKPTMIDPKMLQEELSRATYHEEAMLVAAKALIGILEALQRIAFNGVWIQGDASK